jgi:hypothetical protein
MRLQVTSEAALVVIFSLAGACASTPPAVEKTIEPPAAADTAFVLSREPTAAAKPGRDEQPPVHVGDAWWGFRASFLEVSEGQARERDAAISERQPPDELWDRQTSVETIAIWSVFCNECHGGRRKLSDVVKMPVPAPAWGRGEGLFFGARRPYAEIFRTISNGKIEKEANRWRMPSWKGKLSREQIWSLIYFVEYQSGGIEGRFPPSLYPRGEGAER